MKFDLQQASNHINDHDKQKNIDSTIAINGTIPHHKWKRGTPAKLNQKLKNKLEILETAQ